MYYSKAVSDQKSYTSVFVIPLLKHLQLQRSQTATSFIRRHISQLLQQKATFPKHS